MKTTLLITGVAGFIGAKIAERALEKGYEVIGVDDLSSGQRKNIPSGITFYAYDLSDKKLVDQLPGQVDYILHLAGQSSGEISFDNPISDLEKNTHSTLNLIQFGIVNKVNLGKRRTQHCAVGISAANAASHTTVINIGDRIDA